MSNFQMPIDEPREIIPRLGKKEHWEEGRSAFELAAAWMNARGIPDRVRQVLDQASEWRQAELLDAIFERETQMPGQGRASQTDLLGIVRLRDGNAVLAVEGKVDEPFGDPVSVWLQGEPRPKADETDKDKAMRDRSRRNRLRRLSGLREVLGIDPVGSGHLHYQLFHRTYAALIEAQRFRYARAVMMVHSFHLPDSGSVAGFEAFRAFSKEIGIPVVKPDSISDPKRLVGVELRLGWVSDRLFSDSNRAAGR